jgi:hypothetical protein
VTVGKELIRSEGLVALAIDVPVKQVEILYFYNGDVK